MVDSFMVVIQLHLTICPNYSEHAGVVVKRNAASEKNDTFDCLACPNTLLHFIHIPIFHTIHPYLTIHTNNTTTDSNYIP